VLRWKAMDTFEAMALLGIKPNPLYSQGMDRVGCFPCINSDKETIRTWAQRWPEHVDRLEEWEAAVGTASKRGNSSFFPAPEDGRAERVGRNVRQVIQWSKTARGGKQLDLLASNDDAAACSSSYGLCEN
jgi:3'-phosphoadenosine 5'-phosphosulfate sulfotransferase (PAPS reductase)/FAD synthetase